MKSPQLIVRLDQSLLDALDAYAERLNCCMPGLRATRSTAARNLLQRALASESTLDGVR